MPTTDDDAEELIVVALSWRGPVDDDQHDLLRADGSGHPVLGDARSTRAGSNRPRPA